MPAIREQLNRAVHEIENSNLSKDELLRVVYPLLEYELYADIKFKKLPMCLIPNGTDHFLNRKSRRKIKSLKCASCKLNNICNGFYPEHEHLVSPVPDLPVEVIIEVTDRCNQDCYYCFNKFEYNLKNRNRRKTMTTDEVMAVIRKVKNAGITHIRFSGGEPLLREDIFKLIEYAKSLDLEVWLNTNATLIDKKKADFISKHISNILIPLNGFDDESDTAVTKLKNSFKLKMRAVEMLKVRVLRAGIVLTEVNVKNLERFYELADKFTLIEFYRPVAFGKFDYLRRAIDKIYRLNKKYKKNYKIANAMPFCFYKPRTTARIALGAIFDDGHSRIVVSSNGDVKPSYYFTKIIGNILEKSIYELWNDNFMLDLRNLKYLPQICKDCKYRTICRGGSRALAYLRGDVKQKDVLI